MNFNMKQGVLASALMAAGILVSPLSHAGGTITFGEDKYISVGFGARASYGYAENGAANAVDDAHNFALENARLYFSGSLNKYIKGMFNTEKDIAGQPMQVIDANVQISLTPELTLWAGRFLSPSDRANMAGPFYSLGGGYWAGIASRYGFNGGYIGRDDGVGLVGTAFDGMVSYSFGAFEGNTAFKLNGAAFNNAAARQGEDGLMYAGRLQIDFWDAEPGYYGTGNYLGAKDILAIGLAGRTQKNGAYSAVQTGDYSSYSVDFLLEKKDVGPGAVSVEAAYYDYDTDGVFLGEQGKAYSAGAGYIFNDAVGWGKFQPYARYQKFKADSATDTKAYDLGLAYIIDGYNMQISGFYRNTETKTPATNVDVDSINVAMQFQF